MSNETSPTYQVSSNWSDPHSTENVSESQCYHFKKTHILFYKLVLSHTENSMEWGKQHFSLCCSYFFFSSKPQSTQAYNFKRQSFAQNILINIHRVVYILHVGLNPEFQHYYSIKPKEFDLALCWNCSSFRNLKLTSNYRGMSETRQNFW